MSMFKNRRPADTVPKFPSRLRRSRRNNRYAVRTEEEAHVRRQKYADIPFFRSAIKQFRCSSFQSRVVQKQQKRSVFPERGVFGSARREKITASRRTADLRGNDCPPCMGFLKGGAESAPPSIRFPVETIRSGFFCAGSPGSGRIAVSRIGI